MVFFWLTEDRLETMLNARAYRDIEQDVLIVDSESLITAYEGEIRLSPINSGCTKPWPQPRDRSTFLAINKYSYDFWVKKRGWCNDLFARIDTHTDDLLEIQVKEKKAHETTWKREGELIRSVQKARAELCHEIDTIIATGDETETGQ